MNNNCSCSSRSMATGLRAAPPQNRCSVHGWGGDLLFASPIQTECGFCLFARQSIQHWSSTSIRLPRLTVRYSASPFTCLAATAGRIALTFQCHWTWSRVGYLTSRPHNLTLLRISRVSLIQPNAYYYSTLHAQIVSQTVLSPIDNCVTLMLGDMSSPAT